MRRRWLHWHPNDDVLWVADVLVLSFFDHGPQTVGLINRTAFSLMKPGARVVMFVGSLGVDEEAAFEYLENGYLAGMAINQWWERWSWRSPHEQASWFDSTWGWAPPSRFRFDKLPNVIMGPNSCEKSDEYWQGCAKFVAKRLGQLSSGTLSCGGNAP